MRTEKSTPNDPLSQAETEPIAPSEIRLGAATGRAPEAPARSLTAQSLDNAEAEVVAVLHGLVMEARRAAAEGDLRAVERDLATAIAKLGGRVLALALASTCRAAMERDVHERGLGPGQWRLRTDAEGYAQIQTTFGLIVFPTFTYRDLSRTAAVTRYPARLVFPLLRHCRSSPLSLEWEALLGSEHPFRQAEEAMKFLTRGMSTVGDTTIERHMVTLCDMVDWTWLYVTPEQAQKLLAKRATRDSKTGRPIIYVSTDAHALRRYVDDSWVADWKMINGVRVWFEDARTGKIVHLGGEFLWGDCTAVADRIAALVKAGVLPNDSPEWKAVDAQVVLVSDGAEWIRDRLLPILPDDTIPVLDPYHLLSWIGDFAKTVYGAGTKGFRAFMDSVRLIAFGKRLERKKSGTKRRGHLKTKRKGRPHTHAHNAKWPRAGRPRTSIGDETAKQLIALIVQLSLDSQEHRDARTNLIGQLVNNSVRVDYPAFLARGLEIGSGAMESLHRVGSQVRLKRAGARWLEETSQAVLTFRMLALSGRWDEFWGQRGLTEQLAAAYLARKPVNKAA